MNRIVGTLLLLFVLGHGPVPAQTTGVVTGIVTGTQLEIGQPDGTTVVRLLGIRAPRPGSIVEGGEPHGAATLAWLASTVRGQHVVLVADGQAADRDEDGRPRRYLRMTDGQLLNEIMVAAGIAGVDHRCDCTLLPRLLTLERRARGRGLGMWNDRLWQRHRAGETDPVVIQTPILRAPSQRSIEAYVRRLGVAPWVDRQRAFEEAMAELERKAEGRDRRDDP